MIRNIPAVDLRATGQNITRFRKEAGFTVRELQALFGFGTPQAIYKWQRGETLPTVDNLVILARVFRVSIDELVAVKNGPPGTRVPANAPPFPSGRNRREKRAVCECDPRKPRPACSVH